MAYLLFPSHPLTLLGLLGEVFLLLGVWEPQAFLALGCSAFNILSPLPTPTFSIKDSVFHQHLSKCQCSERKS